MCGRVSPAVLSGRRLYGKVLPAGSRSSLPPSRHSLETRYSAVSNPRSRFSVSCWADEATRGCLAEPEPLSQLDAGLQRVALVVPSSLSPRGATSRARNRDRAPRPTASNFAVEREPVEVEADLRGHVRAIAADDRDAVEMRTVTDVVACLVAATDGDVPWPARSRRLLRRRSTVASLVSPSSRLHPVRPSTTHATAASTARTPSPTRKPRNGDGAGGGGGRSSFSSSSSSSANP